MRTEITRATVYLPPQLSLALELATDDVREAGRVTTDLDIEAGDEIRVDVELADAEPT